MTKKFRLSPLLLLLILGWATAVSAQSYGFVSPNTRENLKLKEAIRQMNSREELHLRDQAVNLSCVVKTKISVSRALGSWTDGAEHSVVLRLNSDESTLRYVLSRMGREAQQKYVIYFHPEANGPDDLYILRMPSRDLAALATTLNRAGVPFGTFVRSRDTTTIYIIDLNRELGAKIVAAARQLRARYSLQSGNADLFGDDKREQARVKFEQEIKDYETKNPNLPPACNDARAAQRKIVEVSSQ